MYGNRGQVNVQIGDRYLNAPLFPETRFNSWCVAETHVLDSRIIPNGRRDHFEQNTYFADLISHLAPKAVEISQRCRAKSIHRNLIRQIETGLTDADQTLAALKKRVRVDGSGTKIAEKLARDLDRIQRATTRPIIESGKQQDYRLKIARLKKRLTGLEKQAASGPLLEGFTISEQRVLSEVIRSIYSSDDDTQRAQQLVERILKRVRKVINRARQ